MMQSGKFSYTTLEITAGFTHLPSNSEPTTCTGARDFPLQITLF
jgi:hypothetical protein